MKKSLSIAFLALAGAALPAGAATVQADLNDLVLGFRVTSGSGTGATQNLEVNLGSVSLYTHPASSPLTVTRLAKADLMAVYGTDWNTRSDLVWGVVGTAGRTGNGGPDGQPLATLWATKAEAIVGTQSAAFAPGSRNAQFFASSVVESVIRSAPGSLGNAPATTNSGYSAAINATLAGSYTVQDTSQAGVGFGFFNPSVDNSVPASGWAVSDLYELQPGATSATYVGSFGLKADGTLVFAPSAYFTGATPPAVTAQPEGRSAAAGGSVTLTAGASGTPTYQWQHNGDDVTGGTGASLALNNLSSADAGLYMAVATNSGGTVTSTPAIVGVTTTEKVIGSGAIVGEDVVHPNGNHFDQILVNGSAETVTAATGRVTRTSFIDMNDDIVQVEFSGAGSVSLVFSGAAAPAAPTKYNQPTVSYVKGHVGIVVTGANESSNLTIFTVGRATAFDPTGAYDILLAPGGTNDPAKNGSSLFVGHETTTYDGVADVAFVAISSTNGKFGGLRAANATFWADKGATGIYAPGVEFTGPVFVSDIDAMGSATPYLVIGKADVEVRITGGNLKQDNSRAIQVGGLTQVHFKDGSTSGGTLISAQANQGQLVDNGTDVTATVVLAPGQ